MIGACCLGFPHNFWLLKELLSIYLGMYGCYFYFLHYHHNQKSPAFLTLTYFYSFSFPFLPRIQTTTCFCKVRKWDMFSDMAYHIVLIYPLPKMLALCALTMPSFVSLKPFDTLSAEFWLTPGDLRTSIQAR